jgi:hypothetical protein
MYIIECKGKFIMEMIKTYNALRGPVNKFEDLLGRTLYRVWENGQELHLYLTDTHYVRFYHAQDCCETVEIEDICGDLTDLVGEPLTEAEEVYGYTGPESHDESYTWTFYRFATRRGAVTVRWYGSSNGYYSEGVSVDIVGNYEG